MAEQTRPARGMRDFLPEDVRRREYVDRRRSSGRLPALRLRAARDAGAREHRDADRQVRRRRQQADFQGAAPRRARGVGRDRPGAALRPDRAAGARRRRAPRQAAAVLQALPDSAGVARRSAGARPVPRVLPVRRRRDRLDARRWSRRRCAPRSATCCSGSGSATSSIRLNHRGLLPGMLETLGVPADAARAGAGRGRQAGQDRRATACAASWRRAASPPAASARRLLRDAVGGGRRRRTSR